MMDSQYVLYMIMKLIAIYYRFFCLLSFLYCYFFTNIVREQFMRLEITTSVILLKYHKAHHPSCYFFLKKTLLRPIFRNYWSLQSKSCFINSAPSWLVPQTYAVYDSNSTQFSRSNEDNNKLFRYNCNRCKFEKRHYPSY